MDRFEGKVVNLVFEHPLTAFHRLNFEILLLYVVKRIYYFIVTAVSPRWARQTMGNYVKIHCLYRGILYAEKGFDV